MVDVSHFASVRYQNQPRVSPGTYYRPVNRLISVWTKEQWVLFSRLNYVEEVRSKEIWRPVGEIDTEQVGFGTMAEMDEDATASFLFFVRVTFVVTAAFSF